jgi:ribokinase
MNEKILVIGSANMDLSMNIYKMPGPGETISDDGGVAYIPGGRATGAATAFKRLGAETVLVSKLGADLHGQKLYQYFKESGISTAYLKVDQGNPTGLSVILKEGDGTRRTIVYNGANSFLSADNISDAFASMPDAVYTTLELPISLVATALRTAESRGVPSIIDAVGAGEDYPLESLPRCEIFSPNEDETERFTGVRPLGADASLRAALLMYKRVKCKYLIIKQGDRGAFIYDGKHYFMIPAIRAGKTVDTSGAGDAFGAALTVCYLASGFDIKNAVRYAVAVGAITVTRKGGATSVPTLLEVEDFLSKNTI